jgi:uncharacterized protein (TIGR02646 family)
MKQITKNRNEPNSLKQYRLTTPNPTYFGFDRSELKNTLLIEQGYICCYCMQRINFDTMKVEHFKSQEVYPNLQLTYSNLLGACIGNEGKPKHLIHCDTSKANQEISLDTTNLTINCENFIKYSSNGKIYSDRDDVNKELDKILKLNLQTLVDERKSIIIAINKWLMRKSSGKTTSQTFLKQKLRQLKDKNEYGKYDPYCQVAITYIKKKLEKYKLS